MTDIPSSTDAHRCVVALQLARVGSAGFDNWAGRLLTICGGGELTALPQPADLPDVSAVVVALQSLLRGLDPREATPRRVLGFRMGNADPYFRRWVNAQPQVEAALIGLRQAGQSLQAMIGDESGAASSDHSASDHSDLDRRETLHTQVHEAVAALITTVEPDRAEALRTSVVQPLQRLQAELGDYRQQLAQRKAHTTNRRVQATSLAAAVNRADDATVALLSAVVAASGVLGSHPIGWPGLPPPVPIGPDERVAQALLQQRYDEAVGAVTMLSAAAP